MDRQECRKHTDYYATNSAITLFGLQRKNSSGIKLFYVANEKLLGGINLA